MTTVSNKLMCLLIGIYTQQCTYI